MTNHVRVSIAVMMLAGWGGGTAGSLPAAPVFHPAMARQPSAVQGRDAAWTTIPNTEEFWRPVFGREFFEQGTIRLLPEASTSTEMQVGGAGTVIPKETHAALMASTRTFHEPRVRIRYRYAQLRRNLPAQPWETFWYLPYFEGQTRNGAFTKQMNAVVPKTSGLQLSIATESESEGFIEDFTTASAAPGQEHLLEVQVRDQRVWITLDGKVVALGWENRSPFRLLTGPATIALYSEDADVTVVSVEVFEGK